MISMKLSEYLNIMPEGEEVTVWDEEYDVETYFYANIPNFKWNDIMNSLAELITIKEIRDFGVVVNLSEVINNKISNLKRSDLFRICNIDYIMEDINGILAGNVSEEWLENFVAALR